MKNCDEPSKQRLLRRVDPVFVIALKKRLIEDPSGVGIPPLAVVCKDRQLNSCSTALHFFTLFYTGCDVFA